MPWKTFTPRGEIARFVLLARSDCFRLTDLCEQFGISRKQFAAEGMPEVQPRSHRAPPIPRRADAEVEAFVLAERDLHRTWGPKMLQRVLELKHGIEAPPACSTIGEILRRHGLSVRRRHPGAYPSSDHWLTAPTQPNHLWTVDFKGWFLLGDGPRGDPLTVTDLDSHFVVGLKAQPNQEE